MVVDLKDQAVMSEGWIAAFIHSQPDKAAVTRAWGLTALLASERRAEAITLDQACAKADARTYLPELHRLPGRDQRACIPAQVRPPAVMPVTTTDGLRFLDGIIAEHMTALRALETGVGGCPQPGGAWLRMADMIFKLRAVRQMTAETNPGSDPDQ